MSKLTLWLGVISVFLIGTITGGLVTTILIRHHVVNVMRHGPPRLHEFVDKELIRDIDLTDSQRREIKHILEEFDPRVQRFDKEIRVDTRNIMDEMSKRIRTVLSPEQRTTFDENINRMQKRFERRKKMREPDNH
jgi:Spy/CpxP family protein refolding chaperone